VDADQADIVAGPVTPQPYRQNMDHSTPSDSPEEPVAALHPPLDDPAAVQNPGQSDADRLPLPALTHLVETPALLYRLATIDPAGRIADQTTPTTLRWNPGHRITATRSQPGLLVLRANRSPNTDNTAGSDCAFVSSRGLLVLPAQLRQRAGIRARDTLLLTTPTPTGEDPGPATGPLLVLTLPRLNQIITTHHPELSRQP
jgi:hypothetical protein